MKGFLFATIAAAVAIPLALSVINAQAQGADDLQPRAGETVLEYKARIARTKGDREALREALRDANDKAHFEAMRETHERNEAATKRYEKAVKNFDQTVKDQKERDARARESRCNRLSQGAALDWSPSAAARYETYCAN
jgi:hypothetical protein